MPIHKQVTTCRKTGGPTSKFCSCEHCCLSVCSVCGAWEASLTTDCPGEGVPTDRQLEVARTDLDYTDALGWHPGAPSVHRAPRFAPDPAPPDPVAILREDLVQKAIAWVRADRACEDCSILLARLEDELHATLPKSPISKTSDPATLKDRDLSPQEISDVEQLLDLITRHERAKIDFRHADEHALACDEALRQAANALSTALDPPAQAPENP